MSKFLQIVKINILQTFNFRRNNTSKYKSERRKNGLKTLGVIAIVGYIMWYVYYLISSLLPGFITMGKPLYVIAFLFVICSIYVFFFNIFRVKTILFDFKDYDLLMSLPLKRSSVIASKIVSLYIVNLIITLIIMLPGYVAYVTTVNLPNDFIFFLLLLTIPIIPLLASIIMGIILAWITSFFKNKSIGSYIVNLSTIAIVLFISFRTSSLDENAMVNQSMNMINGFSKFYPFTSIFVDLLENISFINLLIYFLLPIVLMGIFIIFINIGYTTLRNRLLKQNIKTDYEVVGYKTNSPLKRLYYKEIKKYFTNSLYVINTAFPCIMIIIIIIAMLVSNNNTLGNISGVVDVKEMISTNIFLVLSIACALSSTTHASISLEGKSLWIMKSIPVKPDTIFLSKIMVTLTILIPIVIIGSTFFGIYFHLSLLDKILLYLLPLAYAVFTAVMGLLLNLMFPKFDYDNEIRVIKQSLPVLLSMMIGFAVVILPFTLLGNKTLLITIIMVIVDIILVIILHYYGGRKFVRL